MLKIRHVFILTGLLLSLEACIVAPPVRTGGEHHHTSIDINVQAYPRFATVPGYPVYYAPQLETNFFFYDGMYWVYQNDNWHSSMWYNGPWWHVTPEAVPVVLLHVPVRYYRQQPKYFRGWRAEAPPRWGDHWGRDWEQRRRGWDRWDRNAVQEPAPLPTYQRQYSGERYPRQVERQLELHQKNYRYQPSDPLVRQQYQEQSAQREPAPSRSQRRENEERGYR